MAVNSKIGAKRNGGGTAAGQGASLFANGHSNLLGRDLRLGLDWSIYVTCKMYPKPLIQV